jgi:hypothetical protein
MELQADARHFVALYETAQFGAAQSVAREQYVAHDTMEIKKKKKSEKENRCDFQNLWALH